MVPAENYSLIASLTPIRDRSLLSGTCYFEFVPYDLPSPVQCWNEGSLYLADTGFDLFEKCFQSSHREFEYYGFVRFSDEQIGALIREFDSFLHLLATTPTRTNCFSRLHRPNAGGAWHDIPEPILAKSLYACAKEIRAFLQDHAKPQGCLWVLGL